jgi:hypothetical protein
MADGTQPITAWRCNPCGRISEERWYAGTHADRRDMNVKCGGEAEGPFYLVHVDQYLDVMLGARAAQEGRPRPDYDPRVDHPERYSDGPY